jgi:acyl carrier protein
MTHSEARRKILQALAVASNALDDAHVGPRLRDPSLDVRFDELQLDSLAAIECCMVLEESVGIEIDPADLATYGSVNGLAGYITAEKAV